ncbi:hypothetical protein Q5752_001666 [Cryptotrichosporon argae]
MSVQEVLASLDGFPAEPAAPTVAPDQVAALREALEALAGSSATPAARQSILFVALQYPSASWEPLALEWAQDEGSETAVGALVARCLADAVFDGVRWVALVDDATPRVKDVATQWAKLAFEPFLDLCVVHLATPAARYPTVKLLISILMTEADDLSSSATSLMARLAAHPLLDAVVRSLLLDTANRLFALSLRLLVGVIPFAPARITPKVPLLMAVLGRAVCWRDRPFVDNAATRGAGGPAASSSSGYTPTPPPAPALAWAAATTVAEDALGLSAVSAPNYLEPARIVRALLVALYGGWPSNVIAFVRDPALYLRGKAVDATALYADGWQAVFPPGVVAARAAPLLREFQLHPSIIARNSDAEMADDKRWTDAAEFASLGHLLRGDEDVEKGDIYDFMQSLGRNEGGDDVRPDIGHQAGPANEQASDHVEAAEENAIIRRLREENELLRLEAKHTDRVRKQYLYHIGRLHRNSLRFNSDEAEIHTFANRLKEQQKTISTLNAELSRQRADASQAQQKHTKWQRELREKNDRFKEDRKQWQANAEEVRGELAAARATVQRQMDELAVVKNERFQLQNQLLEVTPKVQHIEDYEVRIKQLTEMQLLWDDDVRKLRAAEHAAGEARARCFQLDQLVRSLTHDRDAQSQIILQLEQTRAAGPATPPPDFARPAPAPAQAPAHSRRGSRADPSPAPPPVPADHDISFYVHVADNAKKRAERLERENLELQVELERLRRGPADAADALNALM